MIGTETVSEPVDYYPYHLDNEGMLSLAGTPSDITVMNLWMQLDNLPDNWFLDYMEPELLSVQKIWVWY